MSANKFLELSIEKGEGRSLCDCLEAELDRLKDHHESNLGTSVTYIIGNKDNFCIPKGYYDNMKSLYGKLKQLQ